MRGAVFAGLLALMSGAAFAQTRVNSINTNFRWLGPDDKIVVERYDDPRVRERILLPVAGRDRRDQGRPRVCRGSEPLLDRLPRGGPGFSAGVDAEDRDHRFLAGVAVFQDVSDSSLTGP